jgi:hypothetical protein
MRRPGILALLGLAFVAGCGVTVDNRPLPATHPANADQAESPYVPPPNSLTGDVSSLPAGDGTMDHHEHHAAEQAPAPAKPYPLKTCLVGGEELGKMGKPEVMVYEGREIKFCCAACIGTFRKDPAKYLKVLDDAEKAQKPKDHPPAPHHEHEEKK